MPSYSDDFWNEESGKKRVQGVVRLLLSDYLGIEVLLIPALIPQSHNPQYLIPQYPYKAYVCDFIFHLQFFQIKWSNITIERKAFWSNFKSRRLLAG